MQAIILAAGMGKRLKELTQNNTKCMVKVNGVSLIDRLLHQLEKQHLSRIVIVVGYEGQKLIDYIATLGIKTPISYVDNAVYDKTNNIYSLALAKNYLMEEDTLLFESDVIIDDSAIDELVKDPRDTLAMVDKYESWMDGTCVKLDEYDNIVAFVPFASSAPPLPFPIPPAVVPLLPNHPFPPLPPFTVKISTSFFSIDVFPPFDAIIVPVDVYVPYGPPEPITIFKISSFNMFTSKRLFA